IRQRNRKGPHNPAEARGHELAERNEVRLVVALRRRSSHADDTVEIASSRIPNGYANQNVGATLGRDLRDVLQVARVDRVEEPRNGGFGQHDELTLARFDEALVDRKSHRVSIRLELQVLGDVSLEQRNLEGRALGRGPLDLLEQLTHDGSKTGERRIDLAVADGEPGNPRKDPAAQPLEECPRGGERDQSGGK